MARRWPMKLALLPGLRWTGKMIVEGPHPTLDGYQVQWDATSETQGIYDRAVLSAKTIHDWTGEDLS